MTIISRPHMRLLAWAVVLLLLLSATALSAQAPAVAITDPLPGDVISTTDPFTVLGSATNAPAGATVTLLFRNTSGTILGETSLPVDASGGFGSTNLTLTTVPAPGTAGNIVAQLKTGTTILASTQVNVVWGAQAATAQPTATATATATATTAVTETPTATPTMTATATEETPAPQATISVSSPTPGATVPNTGTVQVTGGTNNAPAGALVTVLLRNNAGTLFGEQTVAVGAGSTWSANVPFSQAVGAGTPGNIAVQLKTSNLDVIASGQINVTYGSAPTPSVSITSPAPGTVVPIANAPVTVTGTTSNLPANSTVLVRIQNMNGQTLGEQSVVPNANGSFTVNISFTTGAPNTNGGTITAYAINGGTVIATSQAVNVTWPTTTTPTLTITSPVSGAQVNIGSPLSVTGTSTGLAAGTTILVQVRNAVNDVLGENTTTVNASGAFSVVIPLNQIFAAQAQTANTNGSVIAFAVGASGNTLTTSQPVNLVLTSTVAPSVTILQPANNAVINIATPVTVSGVAIDAPNGTVIVRARRADGSTIVERQTNVTATGQWQVDLPISGVPVNSTGTILAFTRNASNIVVAQSSINVTYGVSPTQALVIINNPNPNSIVGVGSALISVNGFAANVPGNTVVVRALNPLGSVLAQQIVAVDATGSWTAFLNVSVPAGTRGSIVAYATNPVTGRIVASYRVEVTYGGQCVPRTDWFVYTVQSGDTLNRIAARTNTTALQLAYANCLADANIIYVGQQLRVPQQPITPTRAPATIRINQPLQGAQIDAEDIVRISGVGTNLNGTQITARVLDANGDSLGQATISGSNTWSLNLPIEAPTTESGTIYVFAQNNSGAIVADTVINVMFEGVIIVGPGELNLLLPAADETLQPNAAFTVGGTVTGIEEGDEVIVRVLNDRGEVVAQHTANIITDEGGSAWTAEFPEGVPAGRVTIFAYVPSPFETRNLLADAVNVLVGADDGGPYVTLTDPLPYAIIDTDEPFTISGRGGRLFEGNVVVRALAEDGTVLFEEATTIDSPDAGVGGEGDWELEVEINAAAGTRGSIIAFSTSAQDGSINAFASVPVTFGSPTEARNFVYINNPLPGGIVNIGETLLIAGVADPRAGDTVRVQIVDMTGTVLVDETRTLVIADDPLVGIWQLVIELRGLTPGTQLQIVAQTTSPIDGTTLASDDVTFTVGETGTSDAPIIIGG